MVLILPAAEQESFGSIFGRGLGSGASQGFANEFSKRKERQSLQQLGLDPRVSSLSPQAQAAYFKSKFAPEKQLTPLQEAQKNLAEERLKNLQGQQSLFKSLTSPESQEGPISPEQTSNPISRISDDNLSQLAAFAGQPGQEGILGNIAKAEKDKREKEQEKSEKAKLAERKEQIEFHKEGTKYHEELLKNYKSSQNQLNAIRDTKKAIQSGKVKPSSLANIFRSFGTPGRKLSDALLSGEEATVLASIPAFLEGRKELFGVRLSDADLRLLQDKLPDIGKSQEANLQILNLMEKYGEMSTLRYKIGQDITKKNKGMHPLGYNDLIETQFDEMTQPINVINPNTGNTIQIPAYKLSDALKAGAKLANE
jgi:hypothetical protein